MAAMDARFDLDIDQKTSIFQALDTDTKSYLSPEEFLSFMQLIHGQNKEEQEEEESLEEAVMERDSSSPPLHLFFDPRNGHILMSLQDQKDHRKLDSVIISTLSQETLEQLKYVFQMSFNDNQGFVTILAVKETIKHCQGELKISLYDSARIFETIQRDNNIYESDFKQLFQVLQQEVPMKDSLSPRQSLSSQHSSLAELDSSLSSAKSCLSDHKATDFTIYSIIGVFDKYLSKVKQRLRFL